MKKMYVIGSGGFSKQVIEMIKLINETKEKFNLIGVIDDDPKKQGQEILGYKIVGTTDDLFEISKKENICAVIAIADSYVKQLISAKLKYVEWVNLIHPKAIISRYAEIGLGNVICAGVIINPQIKIKNHTHINIGTTIGHDVTIDNHVTIMPGVRLSGNTNVGKCVMLGTGSVILQGLDIENDVIVGAGAILTKSTYGVGTYIGIPAKKLIKE